MGKQQKWYGMVGAMAAALVLSSCNNGAYSSFSYTGVPETGSNAPDNPNNNPDNPTNSGETEGGLIDIIWPWERTP